jgi:hypothetical protein
MTFLITAAVTFLGLFIAVPILLALIRRFGWFVVVGERQAKVYMLFGKVLGIIDEPGLHFLPTRLGVPAFIVHWLGRCYTLDLRLDKEYLRSQAVNSEEGAPMGIGIWYEMFISDPVAFLFKNVDPRGCCANVSNATALPVQHAADNMLADRYE